MIPVHWGLYVSLPLGIPGLKPTHGEFISCGGGQLSFECIFPNQSKTIHSVKGFLITRVNMNLNKIGQG